MRAVPPGHAVVGHEVRLDSLMHAGGWDVQSLDLYGKLIEFAFLMPRAAPI